MKSIRSAAVTAALVLILGACGDTDDSATIKSATTAATAPGTSLAILSPASGSTVKGNVVSLDVEAKGVTIVKADGDTSGRTGHYHVFVDRDPVAAGATIPKEAGIVHTTDDPVVLTGLAVGTHRIVVVYGDGTHARTGTIQAHGHALRTAGRVTDGRPLRDPDRLPREGSPAAPGRLGRIIG